MLVYINLSIISIVCLLIFYLDLRYREIWWGWFLILLFAILAHKVSIIGLNGAFQFVLQNLIILGVQLVGVFLYVRLIKKNKLIDTYLGLGDIVFFVVLCFVFTPSVYLFFFLTVSILAILAFILINMFFEKESIPLAGILSCFLCLMYVYFFCFQENDNNMYTLNVTSILHGH